LKKRIEIQLTEDKEKAAKKEIREAYKTKCEWGKKAAE